MPTKTQAVEIIKLCSEGVPYAEQARILNLPYTEVRNAVHKMAKAGIPIMNPMAARHAKPENLEKYEARAKYKLQQKLKAEAKTRKGQIIAMRNDGLEMREIGRRLGISGQRVYQLIKKYRAEGVHLPAVHEPTAAAKKIAKAREEAAKAHDRWAKRYERNVARDTALLLKLGIPL